MALVVEDGSGSDPAADSYVSAATSDAFFTARALDLPTEAHLLRAMDTLEALDMLGSRTSDTQPLAFPRTGTVDRNALDYPDDAVPIAVQRCQLWLAHYIAQDQDPAAVAQPTIKREKVDVIETEYAVPERLPYTTGIKSLPNAYAEICHLLAGTGPGTAGGFTSVRASHA